MDGWKSQFVGKATRMTVVVDLLLYWAIAFLASAMLINAVLIYWDLRAMWRAWRQRRSSR